MNMTSVASRFLRVLLLLMLAGAVQLARAQADLEINTPAIASLRSSMQQRYGQLAPYYGSGAVGLTRDGFVALRDAAVVPLPQRQGVNRLVAAENQDRTALYREIARANGHPEWEADIRNTFAARWIDKAQPGWWVQDPGGGWRKK
jgi:uncharacterized protein YdbL (DUF1318 family)